MVPFDYKKPRFLSFSFGVNQLQKFSDALKNSLIYNWLAVYKTSHLINFPLGKLPTLSALTKWVLTKWEVDQVGIDKMGIDKWELTKWELTKWE